MFSLPKCLIIFLFAPIICISQNSIKDSTTKLNENNNADGTDFIEVLHHFFHPNKKINVAAIEQKSNRKYQFSILPGVGYTLQSSFVANVSGNIVFRNGTNDSTNYSTFIGGASYTAKQQLLFYLQSNIWSKNDNWNFTSDVRLYKYPQNTYGLGGNTKEEDASLVNYSFLRFYGTLFKKVASHFYVGAGYMLDKHWNIAEEKTKPTDFDNYGFKTESISSGVSLNLLSDTRDNPINAQKGYFANAVLRYNTTMLGSNNNWTALIVDLRKYYKIGSKNTVLALWSYNWLTLNGNAPYLDLPSTAWDSYNNLGRGYTQSRFRSPDLLYVESELRFNLSKNKLFGAVLFANAQSYSEFPSKKFEKIIPGFGTGLRLKFNKHSRTNLALDYGLGIDGSGGIFVNLGEVF